MRLLCERSLTWVERCRRSHWAALLFMRNVEAAKLAQTACGTLDGIAIVSIFSRIWSCFDSRAGSGLLNGVRRLWTSPSGPECELDRQAKGWVCLQLDANFKANSWRSTCRRIASHLSVLSSALLLGCTAFERDPVPVGNSMAFGSIDGFGPSRFVLAHEDLSRYSVVLSVTGAEFHIHSVHPSYELPLLAWRSGRDYSIREAFAFTKDWHWGYQYGPVRSERWSNLGPSVRSLVIPGGDATVATLCTLLPTSREGYPPSFVPMAQVSDSQSSLGPQFRLVHASCLPVFLGIDYYLFGIPDGGSWIVLEPEGHRRECGPVSSPSTPFNEELSNDISCSDLFPGFVHNRKHVVMCVHPDETWQDVVTRLNRHWLSAPFSVLFAQRCENASWSAQLSDYIP